MSDPVTMSPLNYYSAPQASIYINGILLDECYDIQYTYRESKEPIYGYLSKFFDALIGGTVIITGSFTINYVHDQYLTQVLRKAKEPNSSPLPRNGTRGTAHGTRALALKEYQKQYQRQLSDYAKSLEEKKSLTIQKSELEKSFEDKKKEQATAIEQKNNEIKEAQTILAQNMRSKAAFLSGFETAESNRLQESLATVNRLISERDKLISDAENVISPRDSEIVNQAKQQLSAAQYEMEELKNKKVVLVDMANKENDEILWTELSNQILDLESKISEQQYTLRDLENIVGTESAISTNNFADAINRANSYSAIATDMLNSDSDLLTLKQLDDQVNASQVDVNNAFNKDVTVPGIQDVNEQLSTVDSKLKEVNPTARKNDLMNTRNALAKLTITASDIAKADDNPNTWERAEDVDITFDIEFEFNGAPHKRLVHCSLIGHGHQISQSGQPIKEYYQFVSKKFEYQ